METIISSQDSSGLETFGRIYDLTQYHPSSRTPFSHQNDALRELRHWYCKKVNLAGGILALPTGGGKTFTAWRFLCQGPLSEGYKVLWLAHTHHLLEQAFYSLQTEAGLISNRKKLKVRVVSGTTGHFKPAHIEADDDVLISTLQTITRAYFTPHPRLEDFLCSAGSKLVVVFDEAHHAPAPSYRKFIQAMQERCSDMKLLGLTATPTYTDEEKKGWLRELFPQKILYQTSVQNLIGDNILAKPIFEEIQTSVEPDFSDENHKKWLRDYKDIGEKIVTELAENSARNALIADTYVKNRHKYGKTIIFSDRWFQCEALRGALIKAGVRADAVYSHVDARIGNADERNKRTADENKQIIEKFKRNELDVLINVRILTEGTDIPDVKTVFLTRQTTSRILLTQMVGRALRGSKSCPGKDEAYVVSFIDDWKQEISWARFDLEEGGTDESDYLKREPIAVELISIELLRRLCDQMYDGININPAEFLTFLPVGWYRVQYETSVDDTGETEIVQRLVMVYEHEQEAYQKFIEHARTYAQLERFAEPDIKFEDNQDLLEEWRSIFFENIETIGGDILANLFHIVRDIGTLDGHDPLFFEFEQRKDHDLDAFAQKYISTSPTETYSVLKMEYEREDRFWKSFYPSYDLFWSHYMACQSWLLKGGIKTSAKFTKIKGKLPEPPEEIKRQVRERDKGRCLCCGSTSGLQVDHIKPKYYGGIHSLENLQTLCQDCNGFKGSKQEYIIDFRLNDSQLQTPPASLPGIKPPSPSAPASQWEEYLRRVINFFYSCHAVKTLKIAEGGRFKSRWEVVLYGNNDPAWIKAHSNELLKNIQGYRNGDEEELNPRILVILRDESTFSRPSRD